MATNPIKRPLTESNTQVHRQTIKFVGATGASPTALTGQGVVSVTFVSTGLFDVITEYEWTEIAGPMCWSIKAASITDCNCAEIVSETAASKTFRIRFCQDTASSQAVFDLTSSHTVYLSVPLKINEF